MTQASSYLHREDVRHGERCRVSGDCCAWCDARIVSQDMVYNARCEVYGVRCAVWYKSLAQGPGTYVVYARIRCVICGRQYGRIPTSYRNWDPSCFRSQGQWLLLFGPDFVLRCSSPLFPNFSQLPTPPNIDAFNLLKRIFGA